MRPEEKYFSFIFWGPSGGIWHLTRLFLSQNPSWRAYTVHTEGGKWVHRLFHGTCHLRRASLHSHSRPWSRISCIFLFAVDAKNFWPVIMCTRYMYIEEGSHLATFTNQSPSQFSILLLFAFLCQPLSSHYCVTKERFIFIWAGLSDFGSLVTAPHVIKMGGDEKNKRTSST